MGWMVRTAVALAAVILLTGFLIALGWDPDKWNEKGDKTDESGKSKPE